MTTPQRKSEKAKKKDNLFSSSLSSSAVLISFLQFPIMLASTISHLSFFLNSTKNYIRKKSINAKRISFIAGPHHLNPKYLQSSNTDFEFGPKSNQIKAVPVFDGELPVFMCICSFEKYVQIRPGAYFWGDLTSCFLHFRATICHCSVLNFDWSKRI